MIKVFVSSTFADMHAERDAIQMFVLPKIRKLAEQVGEGFDFCDLRWGINTDDKTENECMSTILETCFREIKKCKPYMIVILGDRYGSSPDIDSNALLSFMNIDDAPQFGYEDIKDKSYTNLEVLYGPLSDDEQFRRTVFMFRRPIDGAPPIYRGTQDDCKKLYDFKNAIVEKSEAIGVNNIINYDLEWDKATCQVTGIDRFVDLLSDKIDELLLPVFERFSKLSDLEKTMQRQWLHIDKKAKYFCGMDELLQKCEDMINDKKELIICGAEGSGKSCLLGKLAQRKRSNGNVFPYICEHTTTPEKIYSLWAEYVQEIMRQSHCDVLLPNDAQKNAMSKLLYLLDKYDHNDDLPPLYFFIDGAEKLSCFTLELVVPRYSRITFVYAHVGDSAFGDSEILLENSQSDVAAILKGNMRAYGKDLPDDIINAIVDKYSGCKPIAINLLFIRLALLNATDFVDGTNINNQKKIMLDIIAESPTDEVGLCKNLIALISERTDKTFADAVVGYLAASFSGLRRGDLQQLLKDDGIAWNNAYYSVLVDYFNELFYEHTDGRVEIEHVGLRKGLGEQINIVEFRKKILIYLKSLPVEDGFKKAQIYRYCRELNDDRYLIDILQNDYCKSAAFVRSMGFEVKWLKQLIEDGKRLGADIRLVRFINNVFCRNVIAGTVDITAGIIDSAYNFLDHCNGQYKPYDFAVTRYHKKHLNKLFDDNDDTYERFRYIEKTEGEQFVNALYDYTMRLAVGYSYEYSDDFLAFIKQNEDKIGKAALLQCYYTYSKYGYDSEQASLFKEKCLDIMINARDIDDVFTNVAIGVVDDLCEQKLWEGDITETAAQKFEKYAERIARAVEALDNSKFSAFYLDSCIKVISYYIDTGNTASAEKHCLIVAEKIDGAVFNTQSRHDLSNRAMFACCTAALCNSIGNLDCAVRLYEIAVKANMAYLDMYQFPDPQLAEDYAELIDICYKVGSYKKCLQYLTDAFDFSDKYLSISDESYIKMKTRHAFLQLDKIIDADIIPPKKLLGLIEYADKISGRLICVAWFVDGEFSTFDCREYFLKIVGDFADSCIRQKEIKSAVDVIKRYGLKYDTAMLCGIDNADCDSDTQRAIAQLSENRKFVKNCVKTISPHSFENITQKICTVETIRIIADHLENTSSGKALGYRKKIINMLTKRTARINGKTLSALSVRLPWYMKDNLKSSVKQKEKDLKRSKYMSDKEKADAHSATATEYLGLAYEFLNKKRYTAAERSCDSALEHLRQQPYIDANKLVEAMIFNLKGLSFEGAGNSQSFECFDSAVNAVSQLQERYPNMLLADGCLASMLFNRANCSHAPSEYGGEQRRDDLMRAEELANKIYNLTDVRYYARLTALSKEYK